MLVRLLRIPHEFSNFDNDVINVTGELGVSDQRVEPFIFLFVPVDFAKRNDVVRLKRL